MNREQKIAKVMVLLLEKPLIGFTMTIDGIATHVYINTVIGNDTSFDEYDKPASYNECHAITMIADERLRRGQSAQEFYGPLCDLNAN